MSLSTPPPTLGILGGGQLAQMMIMEAKRMGIRTAVLCEDPAAPAAPLADQWVQGALDDVEAAEGLARACDVVTLDTEHVPAGILGYLQLLCTVRPSANVLRTIQDRRAQRRFLQAIQAPQPICKPVSSLTELEANAQEVGFPCVLKSRRAGYDGKGQAVVRHARELAAAWATIGARPAMLEEFVDFDFEISVLLARSPSGEMRFYPIAQNSHRNQVLRTTLSPAPIPPSVEIEAYEIAARIANALDHVGMMAVELFLVRGTVLLVNEIAPRPHNSGHFTFGGSTTSQFEQHVRAVLDLPLGDPSLHRPAAMVNLFGELWKDGEPDWDELARHPEAELHLYGKAHARPGRKMGHVLVLDDDPDSALRTGQELLEMLERRTASANHQHQEMPCPT